MFGCCCVVCFVYQWFLFQLEVVCVGEVVFVVDFYFVVIFLKCFVWSLGEVEVLFVVVVVYFFDYGVMDLFFVGIINKNV